MTFRERVTGLFGVKALGATPQAIELVRAFGGEYFSVPRSAYINGSFVQAQQASYSALYAGQPNVRQVIDWTATQIVSPSLDFLHRTTGGSKEDASDEPVAASMRRPNDWQGQREFLQAVAKDFLIYENAYVWLVGRVENEKTYMVRVPPYAMGVKGTNRLRPTGYRVMFSDGSYKDLDDSEVWHWRGYSALDPRVGVSKMETLRAELTESTVRSAQQVEFWRSGAVRGGIIKRPIEAPDWSPEGRERFEEAWAARSKGINRGRSPVLEEGMEFVDAGVTPSEAELISSRELSVATVARLYGLHPSIFGTALSRAGGADLKEVRDAAEQDTIQPLRKLIAESANVSLVSRSYGMDESYFFDFAAKDETDMATLFVAAKNATNTAVMTVDEFRGRFLNLPPLPDGQGAELVHVPGATAAGGSPPGTITGGAADTQGGTLGGDNGPKAQDAPEAEGEVEFKALMRRQAATSRRGEYAAEHASLLRKHFRRQRKSERPIDAESWDEELGRDLLKLAKSTVRREGDVVSLRLAGTFDMAQTQHYLEKSASIAARGINQRTTNSLRAAARNGEEAVAQTWDDAIATRADRAAMSRATALAGFAAIEAARQNEEPGRPRLKSWVWSGKGHRHEDLAGKSLPLDDKFANGLAFPGDPLGDHAEAAGCQCTLDVI